MLESLVAIAVIAILTSLTVSVMTQAKKKGLQVVATSNLRQMFVAHSLYIETWEINQPAQLPTHWEYRETFPKYFTCDPRDYWRSNCSAEPIGPSIGSFAYVGFVNTRPAGSYPALISAFSGRDGSKTPLLLSIFESNRLVDPVSNLDECLGDFNCEMPDRALVLFQDGHVASKVTRYDRRSLMTWSTVFRSVNY